MGNQIRVGELEITALNDGVNRLPPMFFPGLDAGTHPELVDDDGAIHCPIGCFLIRGPSTTVSPARGVNVGEMGGSISMLMMADGAAREPARNGAREGEADRDEGVV